MGRQTEEWNATIAAAAEAAVAAAIGGNGNNGNNGNDGNPAQGQVNAIRPMSKLVEQFLKLKPPRFDGRGNTEAAPRWVEELEKAFEVLGCTEEEKVILAVYQLQENASDWWRATKGQKLAEFMRLRLGQMPVDQYEAEFARLSKFAPRMVEDPADKARRFRDGLKPDLRSQMISLNLRGYYEIYDRAQAIERDLMDRAAAPESRYAPARDNRHVGKRPMMGNSRLVPPVRKNIGKPAHHSNTTCRLCGGRHGNGPCPSRAGVCFGCGG
ncbi:uncharacterized protein LOC115693284 [Syzygium oleosum]|uniref:uncharacterized protein LOC115693284 n=1 Tax=Syzygium oleosum TaxID=219896 RepID=UPI0024B94A84|nr:uncharacterized protein LOC115693284 [Syzygium oleosum]